MITALALASSLATLRGQSEYPSLQPVDYKWNTSSSLPVGSDLSKLIAEDHLSDEQLDAMRENGRWLGANWWANRLQDWKVENGAYVCDPNRAFQGWRVAHDMTREITGDLELTVSLDLSASSSSQGEGNKLSKKCVAGFLLGAGSTLDNRMAKALMFDYQTKKGDQWPAVSGSGIAVGVNAEGNLRIIDLDKGKVLVEGKSKDHQGRANLSLMSRRDGDMVHLKAVAQYKEGAVEVSTTVPVRRLVGGIGLLSHPGSKGAKLASLKTVFSDYKVLKGCQRNRSLAMGPIACTHYTVDRGVLKLSAQCMPQHKGTEATLSLYRDGKWQAVATEVVRDIDELALFRIENWDQSQEVTFRVSVPLDNHQKPATYTGRITAEPSDGQLRLATLGCVIHRPWGAVRDWNEVTFFPHHELQQRVLDKKPDMVFFYGDQMYESTPSYVDRQNYHEDYLYKWLFHCVGFREVIRNVPSATIPDDHDVYQGNYWGQGGRKAPANDWNNGGYLHPGAFVAQVHRTQTSHLPDCPKPNSMEQQIPAYFCDWDWGGVSFAIAGDRLFKSGPAGKGLPESGTQRPDHYNNPSFDTAGLDLPGLELLGAPQEQFLAEWATDWGGGSEMKALLSQSPFGNLATHHSGTYLIADLDSNGWPQSGRKRALEILRSARAVHIAGDQHLSTMVQHGIDEHNDSIFGFTAPAVANAYARAYHPTYKGNYYKTTPPQPAAYLGERLDGFKNKVTFHAVANPDTRKEGPYYTDYQPAMNCQVPGFGVIDFDTKKRTTTFHSLPRSYQVAGRLKGEEYPGWPVTVEQHQNDGRQAEGELMRVQWQGSVPPVVSVYGPQGKLQWSERMKDLNFTVLAYSKGEHRIQINGQTFKAEPAQRALLNKVAPK